MEKADPNANLFDQNALEGLQDTLPAWKIVYKDDMATLSRTFGFSDFVAALAFTNKVGEAAESANHHPRICLTWGEARVEWWSHSAGGVTANDVNMAKATDACFES